MTTVNAEKNTVSADLHIYFCLASGTHSESTGAGRAGKFYFFNPNGGLPSSILNPNDADYKLWYGSFVKVGETAATYQYDPAELMALSEQAAAAEVEALRSQISKVYAAAEAKAQELKRQIESLTLLTFKQPEPAAEEFDGELVEPEEPIAPAAPKAPSFADEDVDDAVIVPEQPTDAKD